MNTNSGADFETIEALLPWYVSGTLDAERARRVEAALAERPALRASLRLVEQDRENTIALNEALGDPGAQAWARVLAVAEAEPRKPTLTSRLAAFLGLGVEPDFRRVAWIGAAAASIIALQGVAIVSLMPARVSGTYKVASAPSAPADGDMVHIAFNPGATIDQIAAFLRERHAVIVDGPRGDYFRVQIGASRLPKAEFDALVAELRNTSIVAKVLAPNP